MDLKSTINNTNTQKENVKTVATNIDNKLVELGGEQAINLADVPNKMEVVENKYVKMAEIDGLNTIINTMPQTIKFSPLTFIPKKVFVSIYWGTEDMEANFQSDVTECSDTNTKIHSLKKDSFIFADELYKKDDGWSKPHLAIIRQLIFMG